VIVKSTLIYGAANLAVLATLVSLLALLSLHVLSSEFDPSWRMVSEYANGRHRWVLTLVFFSWAVSTFALFVALSPLAATWLGVLGLGFLVLAGVGQLMGGLFDVNHKLHGAAFAIGIPSLVIAAILLTMAGRRTGLDLPLWAAALPLLSVVLMAASMMMLFSSLKASGIEMAAGAQPLDVLPVDAIAWNGWANRLVFAAYYGWVVLAALAARNVAE
jgi:hypothetical protein